MDSISKEHRSWNMSRIRGRDTKPELVVRSMLHRMGYRFRLNGMVSKKYHPKGVLPGKPDIVLAKYKTVIFIHGCFWHRHEGCKRATTPSTNREYWDVKFKKNIKRDKENIEFIETLGWKCFVLWECFIKGHPDKIEDTLKDILENK